jgi:hypothetical protein
VTVKRGAFDDGAIERDRVDKQLSVKSLLICMKNVNGNTRSSRGLVRLFLFPNVVSKLRRCSDGCEMMLDNAAQALFQGRKSAKSRREQRK